MRCLQKQALLYEHTIGIAMDDLNPNTQRILEYIQKNPGCYLRQIKRKLDLSMGVTQYHLNLLEKMGKIMSERHTLHRSYYPIGIFEKDEKQILKILNQETRRNILLFIIERKNPTQTDIIERIKISAASVNWHIHELIKFNIINETRDGKYKRYELVGSSDYIVKLIKKYHPRIWQRWSDTLVEIFLTMGVAEKNDSD